MRALGAVAILLALAALAVLLAWGLVASGAWKPLAGFAIAAVVIAGVSIGIQRADAD